MLVDTDKRASSPPRDATAADRKTVAQVQATKSSWIAVLGWSALEAIGAMRSPENPDLVAAELFDALRLRGPVAAAFAAHGTATDEDWRAAARLRASFAHSSRSRFQAQAWIHDPDVAWVIGVHEYEGVSYLVKEHFEKLLWWMALRDLLEAAAAPKVERGRLALIEASIRECMKIAESGGYRVEVLEEAGLLDSLSEREEKLQEKS